MSWGLTGNCGMWAAPTSRSRSGLSHRARRHPGRAGRAGRCDAGGGDRPRGPPRRQASSRLRRRQRRPVPDPRRAGPAAARLHGARGGDGARRAAAHPQRQTRPARPARTALHRRRPLPAPATPTEQILADIYAQVLALQRVGVEESFSISAAIRCPRCG
ncbi:putative linear gramicidin synthetase subunit B [Mycobacterium xenopi 4042]|uniref:Putative linear gramicidin synthetase subunit B n=1 Tax=Mycobacterium xenopi 4042 TaxID=1299334 RepID=X8AQ09_MYCXE|nr:putative linear gramicidin synthetase subunit B [Mycobacterium xenopi 4042]